MKTNFEIQDRTITCTITERNRKYVGVAKCHPEDEYNEQIGRDIAYDKACLRQAKAMKAQAIVEYKTIKQLYDALRQRPHFNKNHIEFIIVQKRYYQLENEVKDWDFCIKALKTRINESKHGREIYDRLKAGLNKPNE